jgi:NAD(P)-dependent dehydrogenase (short-subunit alcohol dehydrogenase family)
MGWRCPPGGRLNHDDVAHAARGAAGRTSVMPSAIVTASDSGIGKATAVLLARRGFDVGITWRSDEAGAEGTAGEVRAEGRVAEVRHLDLSDATRGPGVVDELAAALGGLDVLVNNAGTGDSTPFLEVELERWRQVLEVDLTGAFLCGQAAARRMVEQGRGGRIINITSIHEHVPLPGSAAYCAAKGGLGLLTKVMALELAAHGITVNSVAPGEIATPMTGNEDVDPASVERPGIPARRPGAAAEIAEVVAFLAAPGASYVTGASYVADGGLTLMAAVQDGVAP